MREDFIYIRDIPTHVMTWGRWVEEPLEDIDEIVICITGNPGLPGFYSEFLSSLCNQIHCRIPVWVVGHAGHVEPPKTNTYREVPQLRGNYEKFDLNGQINHKIEFIEKYVPAKTKIHLIGHSIGAWIVLQMLNSVNIKNRVKKCYMLFPTIERMAETENGWMFTKIALPFYSIFNFLIVVFNYFPVMIRVIFIYIYFLISKIPTIFIGTALKYAEASVMEKVIFLAKDEMKIVRDLPLDLIKENLDLLKFFYGTTDGWVPVDYYEDLKKAIPNVDTELDRRKIDHAFVLRFAQPMSTIVAEMISKYSDINE